MLLPIHDSTDHLTTTVEEIREFRRSRVGEHLVQPLPDSLLVFKRGEEIKTTWTNIPISHVPMDDVTSAAFLREYLRIGDLLKADYVFDALAHQEERSFTVCFSAAHKPEIESYRAIFEAATRETSEDIKNRCEICDWSLAESVDKGCVLGNCSSRPHEGTPEYQRIQERREALKKK